MDSGYSDTGQRTKEYRGIAVLGRAKIFGLQFALRPEYAAEIEGQLREAGYFPWDSRIYLFDSYVKIISTGVLGFTDNEVSGLKSLASKLEIQFIGPDDTNGTIEEKLSGDSDMQAMAKQLITQ